MTREQKKTLLIIVYIIISLFVFGALQDEHFR